MNVVYVVTCDGKISTEGYANITKAIDWVEHRYNEPKRAYSGKLEWRDLEGRVYKIHEIAIK